MSAPVNGSPLHRAQTWGALEEHRDTAFGDAYAQYRVRTRASPPRLSR